MIPPSVREQVLEKVVAALEVQQQGEAIVPAVGRSHAPLTEGSSLPRQDVLFAKAPERLGEEVQQVAMGDRVMRSFAFAVVSKWAGENGQDKPPIDKVGDPLLTRTVRALITLYVADVFSGLPVQEIRELGTDFDYVLASRPLGEATTYFLVIYETRRSDPTRAPQMPGDP